jgi:glycosyltransferase involved in cell wall biosynthesis
VGPCIRAGGAGFAPELSLRRQILLNWSASNTFGWGLVGLGIVLQWAFDPDVQPVMGFPLSAADFPGMDPARALALAPTALASQQLLDDLKAGTSILRERGILVMDALSNGLKGPCTDRHGMYNVGRCVLEDTKLDSARSALAKYDSLLCASNWNAALLRAHCDKPVAMIHEGIDQAQFFPRPKEGFLDPGRFYIFSGGKIEFRKAHDLVLLAFREFAARHDDAVLVTAWHSAWPRLSAGFKGRSLAPVGLTAQGELDVRRWVAENGIEPRQFIELPRMPNSMLPSVLREMDCAVQVSRCEPCTNLPAKEAMACGIPVVLADNTGTRDLIDADNCIPLRSQGAVAAPADSGTEGWGETSVEEIVAALERLYTDTQYRKRIGTRGAEWIVEHRRTWRDHAKDLKDHLRGLYPIACAANL